MPDNIEQPIGFSEKYLKTTWLTNVCNYHIENRTIVVNLGQEKAHISVRPEKYLLPRTSTIIKDVSIKNGDSLLLIEILDETNIGGIVLDSLWNQLGEMIDFPKDVPCGNLPNMTWEGSNSIPTL
jgi:hypothetical protein